MTPTVQLDPEAVARLAPLPRHERAMALLTGDVGPLATCPLTRSRAVVAYVVYLAWLRARHGMLGGRPDFEAWDTLAGRLRSAIRGSDSARAFAVDLFGRLRVSITGLHPRDALWWTQVRDGVRWHELTDDTREAAADVVQGAKLVADLLRELPES